MKGNEVGKYFAMTNGFICIKKRGKFNLTIKEYELSEHYIAKLAEQQQTTSSDDHQSKYEPSAQWPDQGQIDGLLRKVSMYSFDSLYR